MKQNHFIFNKVRFYFAHNGIWDDAYHWNWRWMVVVGYSESATVQYSLDKTLKDKWNFVVGSQYQLNKHWMIRAEYGFLGSRVQFMTSLQYRFRL